MRQHGFTIITPVLPGQTAELTTLLNKIGNDIGDNGIIDFYALTTVHFLRWAVLPGEKVRGTMIPDQLVLSTNFDGSKQAHLEELATKAGEGLRKIYQHCEGFPASQNPTEVANYLRRHVRKNAAFYVG
ncbi:MAG: hypothetical protein AAF570_04570, partial [Bacteroidota bacterium]